MIRWFAAITVACAIWAAPVAAQDSKPAPKRVSSWYAATVAEDDKGQFLMIHFWSKGALFRSEAVLAGRKILTIVNATTYYIIDEVSGVGIQIQRSEAAKAQDGRRERPFGNEVDELLLEGGELLKTEKAAGQTVEVYRLTNDAGRRTIWMSTTKPAVPLRIETYDRASATTGKIDYVNWLQNPPLRDDFFAPDPRIKIEKFGYEEYRKKIRRQPLGPAPVLYRHLLHGEG